MPFYKGIAMEMDDKNIDEYITYNGFNRPALVMGVPLLFLLGLGMFAMFGFFLGLIIFGFFKAIIFPFISGVVFFIVRAMCETEPNAMRIAKLRFNGFLLKFFQRSNVISFHCGDSFIRRKYERQKFKFEK